MIRQSIEDITKACGGKMIQRGLEEWVKGISTDSRSIEKNSLFIPLIGERFDGHDFLETAVKNGVSAILYEKGKNIVRETFKDIYIIEVENTLAALQDISKYYRNLFDIPIVAITGSTGKTSTKDMVSSVLSSKYNVLKNIGNLNNHIGLPLTLFNLDTHHEMAVLEMGMSGFGEILKLTEIARPTLAVITNIGLAHIEHLGSRENIMKAKMEIANDLDSDDYLILNGDNDLLKTLKFQKSNYKKIFFGLEPTNDIYPKNLINLGEEGFTFDINIDGKDCSFRIKQPGIHNVYNALVAIGIGRQNKIEVEAIAKSLLNYTPSKMRMEVIEHQHIKIINDAYNASPDSMEAALSVLVNMKGDRKIAVLGDMFEMGEFSEKGHRIVGACAVDKTDILITVGKHAKWIAEEAVSQGFKKQVYITTTNQEAIEILNNIIKNNDVILVKGSRGMAMEEIVDRLQERS